MPNSTEGEAIRARIKQAQAELDGITREFNNHREVARWLYDRLMEDIRRREEINTRDVRKRLHELEISYRPFCRHPIQDYADEYCFLCGERLFDSDEDGFQ